MSNAKRRCLQCRNYFPAETGTVLPAGFFHSEKCIFAYANKVKEKQIKKARVAQGRTDKQTRSALRQLNRRTVSWQHNLTQPRFNRMRVLEELKWFSDKGLEPTCISCQLPLGGDIWCCGHFKTQGGNGRLRYDRKNTYLQHNRSCNMGKSGDPAKYAEGIVKRFGYVIGMGIVRYCEQNTHPKKWDWQCVEKIRTECNQRIRELEA